MIITVSKPFSEIEANLRPHARIFVVGCAACATKCRTGSEEAVKRTAAELAGSGKTVAGYAVLDTTCDIRVVKKDLSRLDAVKTSDALLILACGAGVQAVEKVVERPVYPGLNPVFIGTTERIGVYREYCRACGDCLLEKTGGICPLSRCPKGLVNGPCGSMADGKCEVDTARDCAWVLIRERLRKTGQGDGMLDRYIPPRSFARPREISDK